VLYPTGGITKTEIINYYGKIAPLLLPHIRDRPLVIQRYPDGIKKSGFYQKNTPTYYPRWIKRKKIQNTNYAVCNDKETLLYFVNQASLVIHSWQSRVNNIKKPDRIIIDLDPDEKEEKKIMMPYLVKGALAIREILQKIGLTSYLMSTGSKGYHIMIPIKPELEFEKVRDFALRITALIEIGNPQRFTTQIRKEKRKGKVFLDINRNANAQLAVMPYSLRAIDKAPIATPLEWKELTPGQDSQKYHIKNITKRIKEKGDVWKGFEKKRGSVTLALEKLEELTK
jgi:bifunctional non-homologous end joining protein LigD